MASVSFQVARNGASLDSLSAGAQAVSEGTAAPTTANNVEVRIDLAAGWTKREIADALDIIERYFLDASKTTTITL